MADVDFRLPRLKAAFYNGPPEMPDWRDGLRRDRDGKFTANALAYGYVLREDENLAGLFRLDLRSKRIRIWARIPFDDYFQWGHERWLNRDDITAVAEYLESQGFAATDRTALFNAIRKAARDLPFLYNPDEEPEPEDDGL